MWWTSGTSVLENMAGGGQSALVAFTFLTDCAQQSKKQSIYGMG